MTTVEILEEISYLIYKQKKIDSVGEDLSKVWMDAKEENEEVESKIKEPFPPVTIESFKPYIFEEIFQKKLSLK